MKLAFKIFFVFYCFTLTEFTTRVLCKITNEEMNRRMGSDEEEALIYKFGKILTGRPRPVNNNNNNKNQNHHQENVGQASENRPNKISNGGSGSGTVTDVDLQLLHAMEKLVARMDKLETRVLTMENVVLYLSNRKEKPNERGNCPENFIPIPGIKGKCFLISSFTFPQQIFDWKTAAGECSKINARLTEITNYSEFHRIATYLVQHVKTTASTDFWTGGLNPGLLWLWSESGQQVDLDKRFWNDNNNGSKSPGCLKLSYSIRLQAFFFKGSPCNRPENFVCEIFDNSVPRALARFEQEILDNDSEYNIKNNTLSELLIN